MATDPLRTTSRIPWRRGALTVGAVATAAWTTLLILALVDGTSSFLATVTSWVALVLSFATTYLLTRMWSHDAYAGSGPAALGRRLSAAFEILVAVMVVLAFVRVGAPVQLALGGTALACFLAALVLALPRPTAA